MSNRQIHIFAGATVQPVTPHFGFTAPAKGTVGNDLLALFKAHKEAPKWDIQLHLGGRDFYTVADLRALVEEVKARPETKMIVMAAAVVDFEAASVTVEGTEWDRDQRLRSDTPVQMGLRGAPKVVENIRKDRKDFLLVAFKATAGDTREDQYAKALALLKRSSANLVFANDIVTRTNFVVTPEEACYGGPDRQDALRELVDIAYHRSHMTFTRSTVIAADPVPWESPLIPANLREVVNHMIQANAYKPFGGATVGHFAARVDDTNTRFVTSMRKTNFNRLPETGMVLVETDGPDTVIAYGARPSVGGQSQRIIFKEHDLDCIVHAHIPMRSDAPDAIPVVSQREYECGSHQCGQNTSNGLAMFDHGIKAVMLDQHGPNVVFSRDTDPRHVIAFIERNFDASGKTDGMAHVFDTV